MTMSYCEFLCKFSLRDVRGVYVYTHYIEVATFVWCALRAIERSFEMKRRVVNKLDDYVRRLVILAIYKHILNIPPLFASQIR